MIQDGLQWQKQTVHYDTAQQSTKSCNTQTTGNRTATHKNALRSHSPTPTPAIHLFISTPLLQHRAAAPLSHAGEGTWHNILGWLLVFQQCHRIVCYAWIVPDHLNSFPIAPLKSKFSSPRPVNSYVNVKVNYFFLDNEFQSLEYLPICLL